MHKTLTKLTLDIILSILFILLIYPRETGFSFHEIAGLASGVLVIFHLILNFSWVKNVTGNLFNPRLKSKAKFFYWLNTLSFVTLAIVIITGIEISTVLFPGPGSFSQDIVSLHKWLAYVCLGLFGLHLALHWSFFVKIVPRLFKTPGRPSLGKIALNIGALVLTLSLMFSQIGANFTEESVQSTTRHGTSTSEEAALLNRNQRDEIVPSQEGSIYTPSAVENKPSEATVPDNTPAPGAITQDKTNTGSESSVASESNHTPSPNYITLSQYLGNMFCTGCNKHCPLLSPQCSTGIKQAAAAKQKYTAIYGTDTLD